MGPGRGKLLDNFWSMDVQCRFSELKGARGGGSIPPELLQELERREGQNNKRLQVKEEVQISEVHWSEDRLHVTLDDGSDEEEYDMIWLATGSQNDIRRYPPLASLCETLPVQLVNGLPVLGRDLSWSRPPSDIERDDGEDGNEPKWKQIARQRFWCMGVLAGLELGPDALNLVGARHGAVRVAEAIRQGVLANSSIS